MKTLIKLSLLAAILILPLSAFAGPSISNGKLFTCSGTSVVSVRTGNTVRPKKAIGRFKRIIKKQNLRIADSRKGSRKRKRAVAAKRTAKQGIRDVRECKNGTLSPLNGLWNLFLENGKTPAENGYKALTISFSGSSFVSEFTSASGDCLWEGSVFTADNYASLLVTTNTGSGSLGAACLQANGQARLAQVFLSLDGNILTLDYRPGGSLQDFERVS